jgi:hypothetical protein
MKICPHGRGPAVCPTCIRDSAAPPEVSPRDAFYEGFSMAVNRHVKGIETRNGWLDAWNESKSKAGADPVSPRTPAPRPMEEGKGVEPSATPRDAKRVEEPGEAAHPLATLARDQRPLPADFAKVLNDNYWDLLCGSDDALKAARSDAPKPSPAEGSPSTPPPPAPVSLEGAEAVDLDRVASALRDPGEKGREG